MIAPDAATDPTVARVYHEIETELGFGIVPNVFRAMGSHPDFLAANWNLFRSVVLRGHLPRVVKEMVGIVVSVVHNSTYARDVHLHSLAIQGIDRQVLAMLARGEQPTDGLSAAHLAVVEFARAAAASPNDVSPARIESLRANGLDQVEIFEVIAAVQLFTAINSFTDVAAVPLDAL
jgi:uncharacterized peroxidase-related enzyme